MTTTQMPAIDWKKRLRRAVERLVEQKWINVGLGAKMGAIVLIGLVGLFVIFAFLGIGTAQQTTRQALSERLAVARLSAANLDSTIRHIESMLTVIADQEALRDPGASPAERAAALRTGFHQLSIYSESTYLLDRAGRPLASTIEADKAVNWADFNLSQGAWQSNKFSLKTLPDDPARAVIVVPVLSPEGAPVASVAALLELSNPAISPFKNPFDLGATGTIEVVDANSQVLISSHPDRIIMTEEQDSLLATLLRAGEPMVETCVGCSGDVSEAGDQVMAFAPLSQAPWGVLIRQEADEVFTPVRRLTFRIFLLGMAAVVGALGLVWATTSSVVDPVQLLTDAAARISDGDLTTPICCRRGDEIGELAHSFDAMRIQLKRSIDEIQAWNRELDARVQERTEAALAAQFEAQRARDDLRAIIDGLSDELVVIGLDYRIQQVNKAAQQHCPPGQRLTGQYCYDFMHRDAPCQALEYECPLPAVLAAGESVKVTHVHRDQESNQKRYVDIVASPMRDETGQITRVIELMRDVTDEKKMEQSLVRRNQELSILNAVATTVNQSLDLEEILGRTLDELLRLTDIDVGAIFLQKERLGSLELLAHRGLSEEAAHLAAGLGMLDGSCGGVLEVGEVVVVPDLSRYRGRRAKSLRQEKLQTLVHVPLVAKGCKLGSICVATHRQREFGTEEQDLLIALSNQVAVAVENARLYAEVQRKERMRGELLKKVITAQEEERRRIARELHDDTSQSLTALLFAAEEAMDMDDQTEIKQRLENMRKLAAHTLDGVHQLIFDLRPTMLDHLGLVPAIRWFAQSRLEPVNMRLKIEESSTIRRLPPELETALFRVVQEAVNNIARHSGARNVSIELAFDPEAATVVVEDDGLGFDMVELTFSPDTKRGLGLMGMRERVELLGGALDIVTAPGCGARLHIYLPIGNGNIAYV